MTKYEEICLRYFGNKISLADAIDKIRILPRSWHTAEWTSKRRLALKTYCEVCNETENLQIQHTKHPTKIKELKREITSELISNKLKSIRIDTKQLDTFRAKFLNKVNGCSECLRKSSNGKCPNCKKVISSKILVTYYKIPGIKNHSKNYQLQENDKQKLIDLYIGSILPKIKNDIWQENKIQINEYVFKQNYLENIRYLSFVDTITACKKCATKQDSVYIKINKMMKELESD